PWLLVEGPADVTPVAPLARRPGAVVARGLGLRTLGAVLARAGLFIGHDSGVSHLAAAWHAPTLALFGPTDPALWAPVGPRVRAWGAFTLADRDVGLLSGPDAAVGPLISVPGVTTAGNGSWSRSRTKASPSTTTRTAAAGIRLGKIIGRAFQVGRRISARPALRVSTSRRSPTRVEMRSRHSSRGASASIATADRSERQRAPHAGHASRWSATRRAGRASRFPSM